MQAGATFLGIDGCRAGWCCVQLAGTDGGSCRVVPDARGVGELAASVDAALIDIPIGLVEAGPGGRDCDRAAPRLLGARAASVFSPPARATLAARDYAQALVLNRRATGRGLSLQAWHIVPKIRAVDALLRDRPELRGVLREAHPELCFRVLNGGAVMQHNKRRPAGVSERLAVLTRWLPVAPALFDRACARYPRRDLARDDILDAMACAVAACAGYGRYRTLPATPPRDGQGLAMEIVYPGARDDSNPGDTERR
jgi:predicted RNase H-like nuclease